MALIVIVAHLTNSANDATTAADIAYFWARVVHYFVYMADKPLGRTLAFVANRLAMSCIFWEIIT